MQREETRAPAGRSAVAFPLPARLLGIAGVQPLELEVTGVTDLGANMRRILLTVRPWPTLPTGLART